MQPTETELEALYQGLEGKKRDRADGLLTLNEAAPLVGLTPAGLRIRCVRGLVPSHRDGLKWLIPRSYIDDLIARAYARCLKAE
jgi:hypothetical protein